MNNDASLTQNTILNSEHLYAEAIAIILANAERELLIFDQDLSRGNFASLQKVDLLKQFLNKSPSSQLTIILQNKQFFEENCPRLRDLMAIYGHKMTVYETNQTAKHAKDCFILADGKGYVKRIHTDQARFVYSLDDRTTVNLLNSRFNELREATQEALTISRLGL